MAETVSTVSPAMLPVECECVNKFQGGDGCARIPTKPNTCCEERAVEDGGVVPSAEWMEEVLLCRGGVTGADLNLRQASYYGLVPLRQKLMPSV